MTNIMSIVFFFQAEDGIRDLTVTGVQTCALPILDEQPSLRRTRMRHPTSRWRDPDFIVVPMFGAAFIAIVALITGGSENYLYVAAQADPASRIGVCSAKPGRPCGTNTQGDRI